jgi:hypothetical protein
VTWAEALDLVVARTGVARYRELCAHENPATRQSYRELMVQLATGVPAEPPRPRPRPEPRPYPSLAAQAVAAAAAAGRVLAAALSGAPVLAPAAAITERAATCATCNEFDPAQHRCRMCGCGELKLHLAALECPLGKWPAIGRD